ncbi:MAG: phosphoglycerate kinase [Epsilonproteobacteria bacterium]|nr:MAG: phosphoglycerate kinase [Campylobacterota bacterium]RLA66435.1 MAG: phosphoglycerate kinase [Campylobacterota bacterium]
MDIKYIDDMTANFAGKKVLVRFDFNVPLDENLQITDTTRIDNSLPTIKYLLEKGTDKLIIMSHFGRPKGERVDKYSLEPVAKYLAEKLDSEVILTESALDSGINTLLNLSTPKIILLENLRFHPEEEANDAEFAKALAKYGDVLVEDAFGTAHRKHASTYGIIEYFRNKSFGGFLLKKEIEALDKIVKNPVKPFVAIIGGAKVSDKIKIISRLITNVDAMIIGGAMAYPFLKAKGHTIGKSLCSDEDVSLAKQILNSPSGKVKIKLPVDHLVADNLKGKAQYCETADIPPDKMGLDIGEKTIQIFENTLKDAKTILWNGPMGLFEKPAFAKGTLSIAHMVADLDAFSLVGGGDSVAAIKKSGVSDKISHISTGGGASLKYIEEGKLPGINALKFGV